MLKTEFSSGGDSCAGCKPIVVCSDFPVNAADVGPIFSVDGARAAVLL